MPRAEIELRAARRELLLVRAAAERAALASQLDAIGERTRTGLPGFLLHGDHSSQRSRGLRFAASVLRIVRTRPWLVPTLVGALPRLARARTLGWIALVGLAVVGVWWFNRQIRLEDTAEDATDAGELSSFPND